MPETSGLSAPSPRRPAAAASARSRLSTAGSSSLASLIDAALLRGRRLARGALAVVLEVGLRPLRQLEVLRRPSRLFGERRSVDRAPRRPRSPRRASSVERHLGRLPCVGCLRLLGSERPQALRASSLGGLAVGRGRWSSITCPRRRPRRRPRPPPRRPRRSRRRHRCRPPSSAGGRCLPAPGRAGTSPRRPCGRPR